MQLKLKMLILLNFPPERMRELRSKKIHKDGMVPWWFYPLIHHPPPPRGGQIFIDIKLCAAREI